MTPRRQETRPPEQPVRVYKIIALTFLFITVALLGVIVFMSSKRATIVISAAATPVDVTAAVMVGKDKDVSGEVKSTVVKAAKTFSVTGAREEPGVAAGMVTVKNDSDADQTLIATTRLLSADNILFRLKKRVNVPAKGSVAAEVYADLPGAGGDIAPTRFTIPGLPTAKQKLIYAESDKPISGGVKKIGVVSGEDISGAEKILSAELMQKGEAELKSGRTDASAFTVTQPVFEKEVEVGQEVADGFSLSGTATVVGVFYDSTVVKKFADAELRKRLIDDTEKIDSGREEPTVTILEADPVAGNANLQVFHQGTATLNPESKQLEKNIFFGKSKDEVRRYVLKLDHVRGVDVTFRPVWMRSVPYIPDHVSVVIKEGG